MKKRLAVLTAILATGAMASAAHAAGPHQVGPVSFSMSTLYGVTSNGASGIALDGKTAYVQTYLLDRTGGHCSAVQTRAILATSSGVARGPFVNVVVNCSNQAWSWNNRPLAVSAGSTNQIKGLEARMCQTNSAGTITGTCTQILPIII